MSNEEESIKSFVDLTKCSSEKARKYLMENHWNINYALNEYYDKELGSFVAGEVGGKMGGEGENPPVYPEDLVKLFEKYATDPKQPDVITFEGMIQFIEDLSLSMDDLVTIVLAKLLSWKRMTDPITRDQFLSTWFLQGCSHLKEMNLLLADMKQKMHSDLAYFGKIYQFTFDLILDADSKCLDADTAIEYWKLYFTPEDPTLHYPLTVERDLATMWFQFLEEESKTQITKDCWQMLFLFFQRYPSLASLRDHYSEVDPWPYIIDEFYEYLEDQARV